MSKSTTSFREMQLDAIKGRILRLFEHKKKEALLKKQKPPTIYSLYHDLEQKHSELGISYSTFRNTLTESETGTADLYTILLLCQHWHIDPSFVFSPPSIDEEEMPVIDELVPLGNGKFVVLDDPSYLGTFYGYMHSQNTNYEKHLVEFELIIGIENGRTSATMNYFSPSHKKTIFHGIPILAAKRNTIFIVFTMEDGDFFIFQFSYKKYSVRNLYYRKGFALTTSSVTNNPMIQSFVLFAKKLPQSKKSYIDGLLPLADSEFYISKRKYEELINGDDKLQNFNKRLSFLFTSDVDTVYQVSENQIYETLKKQSYSDMNLEEVNRALNILKNNSIMPTRLQYADCQQLAFFAKEYLQELHFPEEESN